MNKDELAQMHEYVNIEFVQVGREQVPTDCSTDFYSGYCTSMQDAIKVIQRYGEKGILPLESSNLLITTLGGFLIAAGEKVVE